MVKHIVFIEASLTGAGEKAIEYALSKGYKVTVATENKENYKHLNFNINYYICETNHNEKLEVAIKNLNNEFKIDAITTTADFYVPQASYVAQKLGLTSLTFNAAKGVRNKFIMRCNLQKHCPSLNPTFALVNTVEEAINEANKWGYPIICKPQDANDSLNVKKINTEEELVKYMEDSKVWGLNSFGQKYADGVLLEGYIEGEEYSLETINYKNQNPICIGVTKKVLIGQEGGNFVEVGVLFPITTKESEIIFEEVSKALKKLEIDCGVIHTECRIKNGQVKILEINPRLMGDMAGSHMIELALGASPSEQIVEIALGNKIQWQPTKEKGAAMFGVTMPKTGVFNGITNIEEIKNAKGVKALKVVAKEGNTYHYPPLSNGDILVRLVAEGETPTQALEFAKNAAALANVSLT